MASMRGSFSLLCNWAKIGLMLLMLAIAGCNTLKKVGDDELLLTKNSIYADEEKITDSNIKSLIAQKPNSSVLGYPLRLNLYNLAKENPDSSFQNWLHRKEKREKRLNNFLVQKTGDPFKRILCGQWSKCVFKKNRRTSCCH